MGSPAKPQAPLHLHIRRGPVSGHLHVWFLALVGVGSLLLGTGLSPATPSDCIFLHKLAITAAYWVTVGCVAVLTCLYVFFPSPFSPLLLGNLSVSA